MSIIRDVRRTDEPHDRLTEIADALTRDLPEGVQAIVFLDEGRHAGMVAHGFDTDAEITEAIARHRRAWLSSQEDLLQ